MSGGLRYNEGKIEVHLLPPEYFAQISIDNPYNFSVSILMHTFALWFNEDGPTKYLRNLLDSLEDKCCIGANEIAQVLNNGSKKYEPRNWEKGMSWTHCYNSAMRHFIEMHENGIDAVDTESDLPHAAHAACNIMFLLTYMHRFPELDDRPKLEVKDVK